jgi:homoserine O-acetyltransferase
MANGMWSRAKHTLSFDYALRASLGMTMACVPHLGAPNPLLDPANREWTQQAPPVSYLRFETTKGNFTLELTRANGPIGADRLFNLARLGYYNDTRFHRVVPNYIVQFGLSGDPEVNRAWKEKYLRDDPPRSMNRRGTYAFSFKAMPNTRNTQIFINLADNTRNDAEAFTTLGKVVDGMDVVDRLYSGYGENSGSGMRQGRQGPLEAGGNAYVDREYPLLDRIIRVTVSTSR